MVEEPKLPSVMEAHEVWDLICQGELKEFFADTVTRTGGRADETGDALHDDAHA